MVFPWLVLAACSEGDTGTGGFGDGGNLPTDGGGDGGGTSDAGSGTGSGAGDDGGSGTGGGGDGSSTGSGDTSMGGDGGTSTGGTPTGGTTSGGASTGTTSTGATATSTGTTATSTGATSTGDGSTYTGTGICMPGEYRCDSDWVEQCNSTGDAWDPLEFCDPIQDMVCDDQAGYCTGPCSPAELGFAYIGCDYYPTVTVNVKEQPVWGFNFAVAVANTTNTTANITVTQGATTVTTDTVAANDITIITLPYVPQLWANSAASTESSVMVADGAYRLRSDQPVTVYQYNPLEYVYDTGVGCVIDQQCPNYANFLSECRSGTCHDFSFTNDASLLIPVNVWQHDYRVGARNHWQFTYMASTFSRPGFYSVVASEDGTTVTLSPSATGGTIAAGGGVAANGTGVVTLDQGDVLQVLSDNQGGAEPNPSDVTGTLVSADKPVQVLGGHKCTFVLNDQWACDHLEETIFPVTTLGKAYLVTAPLIPTGGATPRNEVVRIIAVEDNTNLAYDPPAGGWATSIAQAGGYIELPVTNADFEISTTNDKPFMVMQYMVGQDAPPAQASGDPAMVTTVPTSQYRTDYLFHAPVNYEQSFANITAPAGASIMLDGAPVVGFTAIGGTGYEVARVSLSNAGNGNHRITGDMPFGVSVYGYGKYTSYWYPGGLNLVINPG